jgi:RNA polymerase sigma factor (TIGR02999 family)
MTRGLDGPELVIESVDRRVVDDLFSLAYEELRRLAASVRLSDPLGSISPTTLVNEAWVKLARSTPADGLSDLHLKRIAARAMRQVLVEAARRRKARKRGGGRLAVTLDDNLPATDTPDELLALDASLTELGRVSPRQAAMIEARFFGGMDVTETARLLEVSEATVLRDWRAARAWLAHELVAR